MQFSGSLEARMSDGGFEGNKTLQWRQWRDAHDGYWGFGFDIITMINGDQ
jgi:hypothetical protein